MKIEKLKLKIKTVWCATAKIEPTSKDKSDAGHPIGIQDLHGQVETLSVSTNVHTPPEILHSVLSVQEQIGQHPQNNHQPEPVIQQPEPVREQERLEVISDGFSVLLNWQFEEYYRLHTLECGLHIALQWFNPDPSYEELAAENRRLLLQVQSLQTQLGDLRGRDHRHRHRR